MNTRHLRYANTALLVIALGLFLIGVIFENALLVTAAFAASMIGAALSLYILEVYASILLEALMSQIEIDQNPILYVDQDRDSREEIK